MLDIGYSLDIIASHTDVVGSLLRTSELVAAREALEGNRMTHAEFKAVEDRAVDDAIALQEEATVPNTSTIHQLLCSPLVHRGARGDRRGYLGS